MRSDDLPIRASRRQLFTDLHEAAKARQGEREGRPAFKLTDLGRMPLPELSMITPVLVAGTHAVLDAGLVTLRQDGRGTRVKFGADTVEARILGAFDGRTTITDASRALAADLDWPYERALTEVRTVFLNLVSNRVCVPA